MLRYAEDVARMNRLRLAYERMVPAPLDPRQPLLPRAQVREATLLFTDVRGFTALAERLQRRPGLLLSILNEHFDVAVRAVTRCGGTIEKFLGDGLFASFGAWAPQADHPARGLAAAIGVVGANEGLNRRRASIWGFRLEVGVGVCTGRVVVGPIGTADRYELGIIGDPVNVAARLVAQSGPAEVLLATATYRAVARNVAADLLGNRLVRGRMGRVGLYRLRLGTEAEGAPATLPQSPNAREGASAP
ncbi:MAG: guanylate cyclase [Chloroflexi bacterium]|nr:guanylate cyclase [Chloroflexota bacterium]